MVFDAYRFEQLPENDQKPDSLLPFVHPLLSQVQQELMVVQRAGIGSKTLGDVINTYQSQPDI